MPGNENSSGSSQPGGPIEVRPLRRIDVSGPSFEAEPPAPGSGVNPTLHLVHRLLEHKWLMLFTFLVVGGLAFSGVWFGVAPTYTATARIEVSPVIPQLLEGKSDMVPMYESYRASQVDNIAGTEVIDAVLDLQQVRDTTFYKDEPTTPVEKLLEHLKLRPKDPVKDRLLASLEAKAPRGTQHIYVTMEAKRPGEAKLIVDSVVSKYVEVVNSREVSADDDRLNKIAKEIQVTEANLNTKESSARDLRLKLGTGSPEEINTKRLVRIEELNYEWSDLKRKIDVLSATTQPSSQPTSEPSQDVALDIDPVLRAKDPELQQLDAAVAKAKAELSAAPDRFGPLNPVMEQLQKNVEAAQQRLRERLDALRVLSGVGSSDGNVAGISPIESLQREADHLSEEIKSERQIQSQLFQDAERMAQLNQDIAALQEKLHTFRASQEDINLKRQVAGTVRPFLAYEPSKPTEDKRIKFGAAAIFGAAAAAVGLAFLRVRMTSHVHDTDVDIGFGAGRILGRLPSHRGGMALAMLEPTYAEPLRVVRTTLLHALQESHGQIVQITSAEPHTGKTTIAFQLARSTALVGKRVLLVDADLYRAALSKQYDAGDRGGLMRSLESGDWAPEVIPDESISTLSILPVGSCRSDEQAELLANGRLKRLVDEWRTRYDLVVIDSPPLLGTADALILSGAVDGTIMIVRERHCRVRAVRSAMDAIGSAGGRLLGTVVIGDPRKTHPYYYNYQYNYGTGEYSRRRSIDESDSKSDRN